MVSFAVQKLRNMIRSHLFIFTFIPIALGDWPKKTLLQFMSENVLPMFSSSSLKVSNKWPLDKIKLVFNFCDLNKDDIMGKTILKCDFGAPQLSIFICPSRKLSLFEDTTDGDIATNVYKMWYVQGMEAHIKTLLMSGPCVCWHQTCYVAPTLLGNVTFRQGLMMTCCQYEA